MQAFISMCEMIGKWVSVILLYWEIISISAMTLKLENEFFNFGRLCICETIFFIPEEKIAVPDIDELFNLRNCFTILFCFYQMEVPIAMTFQYWIPMFSLWKLNFTILAKIIPVWKYLDVEKNHLIFFHWKINVWFCKQIFCLENNSQICSSVQLWKLTVLFLPFFQSLSQF